MVTHPSETRSGSDQELTLWHLLAALVVLVVPLMVVVGRLLVCHPVFDGFSLTLVLVALLPPLSLFFVRIKLPGIEVDSRARQNTLNIGGQARSVKTAAPHSEDPSYSPGPAATKVLATLHRYQQQLFAGEPDKRWTFAIGAKAPEYSGFRQAVDELVRRGIAALTPDGQVYLTTEGLMAVRRLEKELAASPFFEF